MSNTGIAGDSLVDPYCKVVEPYKTRISGLVSYTVPKIDVQLSGTWRNNPGASARGELHREQRVHRRGPQPLGRDLSTGTSVTVNLIEPETFFAPRRNSIDMRLAKIIRFGRTRTQVGFDIFNVTNNDEDHHLQPDVQSQHDDLADADGDHAGAVHQVQRAVRLLNRL